VDATARALGALLDGVVLECLWSGAAPSLADVERRALLLIPLKVVGTRALTHGGG
jgi:hypothetical protein